MSKIKKIEADKSFELLIQKEFLSDLVNAAILTTISQDKLTDNERLVLYSLKKKYRLRSSCPSHLFPYVSNYLQEEYSHIHKKICELLYR